MPNQNFDTAFKQKLEGYSPTPSPQSWEAIQAEMGKNTLAPSISLSKVAAITFTSLVLISATIFTLRSTTTTENPVEMDCVTTTTTQHDSQTHSHNSTTKTLEKPLAKDLPTVYQSKKTVTENTTPTEEVPQVVELSKENNVQFTSTEKSTTKAPAKVKEIKTTEKTYSKGEFVTFRFDFQNTTGKNLNSLEIWEEFPSWCDVNSIETTSSDNFHTVKTKIHQNYNEVVWKVKGDFSGDFSSLNNKGFIEYKIRLKEDRKASDLNKNQPQIK